MTARNRRGCCIEVDLFIHQLRFNTAQLVNTSPNLALTMLSGAGLFREVVRDTPQQPLKGQLPGATFNLFVSNEI